MPVNRLKVKNMTKNIRGVKSDQLIREKEGLIKLEENLAKESAYSLPRILRSNLICFALPNSVH